MKQGFLEVVRCDQAETRHQYYAPSFPSPTPTRGRQGERLGGEQHSAIVLYLHVA